MESTSELLVIRLESGPDLGAEVVSAIASILRTTKQREGGNGHRLFVRIRNDPYALVSTITNEVHQLAADQPVERASALDKIRAEVITPERLNAVVFGGFASPALLISVVGVAGVLACSYDGPPHQECWQHLVQTLIIWQNRPLLGVSARVEDRRTVSCEACRSDNQDKFIAEVAIHNRGLSDLEKRISWIFPELLVCLDCGKTQFVVPEEELRVLAKSKETADRRKTQVRPINFLKETVRSRKVPSHVIESAS